MTKAEFIQRAEMVIDAQGYPTIGSLFGSFGAFKKFIVTLRADDDRIKDLEYTIACRDGAIAILKKGRDAYYERYIHAVDEIAGLEKRLVAHQEAAKSFLIERESLLGKITRLEGVIETQAKERDKQGAAHSALCELARRVVKERDDADDRNEKLEGQLAELKDKNDRQYAIIMSRENQWRSRAVEAEGKLAQIAEQDEEPASFMSELRSYGLFDFPPGTRITIGNIVIEVPNKEACNDGGDDPCRRCTA